MKNILIAALLLLLTLPASAELRSRKIVNPDGTVTYEITGEGEPIKTVNQQGSDYNAEMMKQLEISGAILKDKDRYEKTLLTAEDEKHYVGLINSYFKGILKDPDSLKYNSVKGVRQGPYASFVVDYHAKNSFGGYNKEMLLFIFKNSEIVDVTKW